MKYAPYSFSKMNCYSQCPRQFNYKYVEKKDIDKSYVDPIFFIRGRFTHKYLASRLSGGFGDNITGFTDLTTDDKFDLIDKADTALDNEFIQSTFDSSITNVEQYIKFDDEMIATDYKHHLVNGYVDYYAVDGDKGYIVDWKTGKYQETSPFEQLELYSIWLFQKYPNLKEIELVYYYVEHQKYNTKTITVKEATQLRLDVFDGIHKIEDDSKFDVKIGKHCQFCAYKDYCEENR